MKSKFIFLIFIMVLFSSFVVADFTTDNLLYWSYDSVDVTAGDPDDLSGNGNDGVASGTTLVLGGILNEAFDFEASEIDYVEISDKLVTGYPFTVNYWEKVESTGISATSWSITDDTTSVDYIAFGQEAGGQYQLLRRNTGTNTNTEGGTVDTGWHMITIEANSSTVIGIYVDNVLTVTGTGSIAFDPDWNKNTFGRIGDLTPGNKYDGLIDESSIWDRTLSNVEKIQLFNSGAGFNFYDVTPANVTDSVEGTAIVRQVGTVSLTGFAPQTIFAGEFNVSVNDTHIYGGYNFNVESSASNSGLFCELFIDGFVVRNVTRTQIAGVEGNANIQTGDFSTDIGVHNQSLVCEKTTAGGSITISKAVGIGHFLIDEFNVTIPHFNSQFTNVSTGGFTLLNTVDFNISNRTTGGEDNISKFLVLEWSASYNNLDNSSELLSTYINISTGGVGVSSCSFYPRNVSNGSVASVGGDCLIRNATTNATYTVDFYGNGSNASYMVDLMGKEFMLSDSEIAGGTGFPVPLSFQNLTRLFQINDSGNLNHGLTNVFEKVAFSIKSDVPTTATFFVVLVNGTNFTTINFTRDVDTRVGVLIGHDIFEGVPQDSYVSELWADCGGANCTIVGGDGIGYITDVISTLSFGFNISVFDNFDNTSISDFAVVNGAVFNTTIGSLTFFSDDELVNFTLLSDFNGGYFNVTVLNHNTSDDLNISLNQTFITWDCIEKVSDINLVCSSPLESDVFNYNVLGNPHTQSVNVSGYFEKFEIFNVSALEVNILNATLYSTNLSMGALSYNASVVTACTYNITSFDYSFDEIVQGNPNASVGLINGSYNVLVNCTGFAFSTLNVSIENVTQNLNFVLFPANSINFTFYNEVTPDVLLTTINISLDLINGGTLNFTTGVGWVFVQDLTTADYEARYNADGFDARSFFFTVTPSSTQLIKLYLSASNLTESYVIRVADESDADVTSATVKLQKQFITMDGQFSTVEECETNSDGECDMFVEESASIVYRFIVVVDNVTLLTTVPSNIFTLTDSLKIITLRVKLGTGLLDNFESQIGVFGDLSFDNDTKIANFEFIDSRNTIVGGCLIVESRNLFNGTFVELSENCISGFNGDIDVNISSDLINGTEVRISGVIDFTGVRSEVDSMSIFTLGGNDGLANQDNDAILFSALLFIFTVFAVSKIPDIKIQIVIDFGVLLGSTLIGFNMFGFKGILGFLLIGLAINWSRRQTRKQ